MSGDYSRLTDRTRKRFSALLMQQGRVHLDSDWNELVAQVSRRAQLQSLDTFGPAAVPVTTKNGFFLTLTGPTDATIGAGRAYVAGLLAEAFDGETVLGFPLSYLHQPFYPQPPALGAAGLFYLDVWTREVTWLEDPDLLEVALGDIDTTTRLQTVWQVKFQGPDGNGVSPDCSFDLDSAFPPSAGLLSTQAVKPPSPDDPCLLPESGGFRGVENRLYRVEIHTKGDAANATFKWSRENASVATAVQRIDPSGSGSMLTVERIGRDAVLRFSPNDWIEVQDDPNELMGNPGKMVQVIAVNEADRTLTVSDTLTSFNASDATRHTRIRRWDQTNGISGTTGVIPVASAIGTWFDLEDGVQVQLSFDPAATVKEFHVADSWSFAARTADASVEALTNAPPFSIIHHYAPLATLPLAGPPLTDCRTLWPPEVSAGCECVCVTAEGHANGTLTLQMAITNVITKGGGKVCVGPGQFQIRTPLLVDSAAGLTISGTGVASQIVYGGGGAAIAITNSSDVVVEMLSIDNRPQEGADANPVSAVSIDTTRRVLVANCRLVARVPPNRDAMRGDGAGVLLTGLVTDCTVRDNRINAALGVASGADDVNAKSQTYLLLERCEVADNVIAVSTDGVILDGLTILRGRIALHDNTVGGADDAAITVLGMELVSGTRFASAEISIAGNSILTGNGRGIVAAIGDLTVEDNDILGPFNVKEGGLAAGITLTRSPLTDVVGRNVVADNRILGVAGDAISIDGAFEDLQLRHNIIEGTGGGIIMTDDALAGVVVVEGNIIVKVKSPRGPASGIRLFNVSGTAEVRNNTVGLVSSAITAQSVTGILLIGCTIPRIRGNLVEQITATPAEGVLWASIAVLPLFTDVDVSDNTIIQATPVAPDAKGPGWFGIVIPGLAANFALPQTELQMYQSSAQTVVVYQSGDYILAPANRTENATAHGNEVVSPGDNGPIVRIAVDNDIGFASNRCFLGTGNAEATVVLIARTAIVSSNRITCSNSMKIDLEIGPVNANVHTAATVVGNIVHREIYLNGLPLAAPWKPLNLSV